jgi:hypothetical protein
MVSTAPSSYTMSLASSLNSGCACTRLIGMSIIPSLAIVDHANSLPRFIKYNYILSAGMDGGAQVIAFLLTFTVLGGGGKNIPFPKYWGNNHQHGNYDYCMRDPGLGKKRAH